MEYSSDDQPVVDAFLASNGDAKARAALLTLPIWHDAWQDGRSSTAFLALFERLRVLQQAGLIRGVVCSDVGKDKPQGIARDAIMARNWQAVSLGPDGLLIALAGNVHMMRKPVERPGMTIHTAGSLMPRGATMTVDVGYNGARAGRVSRTVAAVIQAAVPRRRSGTGADGRSGLRGSMPCWSLARRPMRLCRRCRNGACSNR